MNSRINYSAAPLLAAEIIKRQKVETWEREAFRCMNLLPRDIDG
jgi:hypothetical protein